VLISKKWTNDPYFGCEAFATKSFDDFCNVKIDLLKKMEKDFENQLDVFVKHDDSTNIDFYICIYLVDISYKFGSANCCLICLAKFCCI
jgi:hypothetical protein